MNVPVVRDSGYFYLTPHLLPTGLVGEGPVPRVHIRVMRNERRTQALSVSAESTSEQPFSSDLMVIVDLGVIELDLALAAQLVNSLFTLIDKVPPGLQQAAGIFIPTRLSDKEQNSADNHSGREP